MLKVRNTLFFLGRNIVVLFFQPKIIMDKKTKFIHARDITSLYSNSDMINMFRSGIRFSSIEREEDVIMELCLREERANMDTLYEPFSPHFYLYLPDIHELRV